MRFAKSYIETALANKDIYALHEVACAIEEESIITDDMFMASRLLEWAGSSRSGVWQWYEGIEHMEAEIVTVILKRLPSEGIKHWYSYGAKHWKDSSLIQDVDNWIDANQDEVENTIWSLYQKVFEEYLTN